MTDPEAAIQHITDLIRHTRQTDQAVTQVVDAWEQLTHADRVELGQRFFQLVDGILKCVECRRDDE